MSTRIRQEIEDDVARITLDDGKVNVMSTAMLEDLLDALDVTEPRASVVVLRGRPGIFSAGFDLATLAGGIEALGAMLSAGVRLIERLLGFPAPVLAVCTGHAYPMGAFALLSSDVRIGVAGPFRIGMNETAIGLTVPLFAVELARHRLSPPGFARITTAPMFDPEEALRLGYLDRVVAPERLDAEIEAEIDRLRGLDRPHFAATKRRVHGAAIEAIRAAADEEIGRALASHDPDDGAAHASA